MRANASPGASLRAWRDFFCKATNQIIISSKYENDSLKDNVYSSLSKIIEQKILNIKNNICLKYNLNIVELNKIFNNNSVSLVSNNDINNKLKNDYSGMRNMVWELESSSPGILSKLESFTELTNLDEIKKSIMNSKFSRKDSGKSLAEAPDDQKVDDLVEKCGSISARNSDILKFPTLLDYIIFLYSRNY
jgi:hypothetical protein